MSALRMDTMHLYSMKLRHNRREIQPHAETASQKGMDPKCLVYGQIDPTIPGPAG